MKRGVKSGLVVLVSIIVLLGVFWAYFGYSTVTGKVTQDVVVDCQGADINQDESVDVADLLFLVDSFGSSSGDLNFNSSCDTNKDGMVDVVDLLTLVGNFGKEGCVLENRWSFIFVYKDEEIPDEVRSFVCNDSFTSYVYNWFSRESGRYNKKLLISDISCPDIGPVYYDGPSPMGWDSDTLLISYLEQNYLSLNSSKYITIFYYHNYSEPFMQHQFDSKYSISHITGVNLSGFSIYYPELEKESFSVSIAHERSHGFGAVDKYSERPDQACLINANGEMFDYYDIMCHRVPYEEGFIFPFLHELIISNATAEEIGWKNCSELHLLSPVGGEIFSIGNNYTLKWIAPESVFRISILIYQCYDDDCLSLVPASQLIYGNGIKEYNWTAGKILTDTGNLNPGKYFIEMCYSTINGDVCKRMSEPISLVY